MYQKESVFKRIFAVLIFFIYSFSILPANEISYGIKQGIDIFEHYVHRADLEQNKTRWEQIVQEGYFVAFTECESELITEYEKEILKTELDKIKIARYATWELKSSLDNKRKEALDLYKEKIREISSQWLFLDSQGNYVETISEEQIKMAFDQWDSVSNKEQLLGEYLTSDIDSEYFQKELDLIAEAEGNRLISGMLYDKSSLKYSTSEEAASAIATKLSEETEELVNQKTQELMESLQTQIEAPSVENSSQQAEFEDWSEKIMVNIQEGIALWEEAELKLLAERTEWERNAQKIYIENEEAWINAFYTLQEKKNEWQDDLTQRINSGLISWQEKYANLESQIESARNELLRQLSEESQQTNRLLNMYLTSYNQSREILARTSQGIENWFTIWQEQYNEIYNYWKENLSEKYSEYFINGEIKFDFDITNANDLIKVKNQISEWKTGYITMIKDKIKAELELNVSFLNTENVKLTQLQKEYKDTEAQIQALPFNPQFSQYEGVRNQYETLKLNLSNIENQIKLTINNINMYKKVVADLQQIYDSSLELTKDCDSKNIIEKLGSRNNLFNQELWESSEILTDTETGWFTFAELAEKNRTEAVKQVYALTGSNAGVLTEYTNNLETEYLKAQAALEYWKQEFEVLENLSTYIKDKSSSVETMEETMVNLEKTSELYEKAIKSYEEALSLVDEKAKLIEDEQKKYEEISLFIEEQKLAVENARKEYQDLLTILNGIKEENIHSQISYILSEIQEYENLSFTNEQIYLEYYNKNKEYLSVIEYANFMTLLNTLKNGNESFGIKNIENIQALINKADEFISVIDSGESLNQDDFLVFINEIAQDEPYAFNILLENDNTKLIRKALEYVKVFYQNQKNMREETISYLEGKTESEIWIEELSVNTEIASEIQTETENTTESETEDQEDPIFQDPVYLELETKINELKNNLNIRKEQIIENYQIYRRDFINQKNEVALETVQTFLNSTNYNLIYTKEDLIKWINEAFLLSNNLEETQCMAFVSLIDSIITMKAAEFFYNGTEIVPENISYHDFMSNINSENLGQFKYYQAIWNETQNKYQEILEKTNSKNQSRTEILSKKVEFAKKIFNTFVSQTNEDKQFFTEKTTEQIDQLINEITILSNQLIPQSYVDTKLDEIIDLLNILEKNQLSETELQNELSKAQQNILEAEKKLNDLLINAENQFKLINEKVIAYNSEVSNAQVKYDNLKNSALEKRKAQEKYEWAINVYLDSETEDGTNTKDISKRYEEAKNKMATYTEAVKILENLSKEKNKISDEEYLKAIEQYESDYEKYYKMLVLKSIIASEISLQEDKTRQAELEEQIALNSLIQDYVFNENNPIFDLIRIIKTDNGYKIDLAYTTECISINEQEVENEEEKIEIIYSKKWESSLIAQEQNPEILKEYLNDGIVKTTVDGINKSSFAEEDCKLWLHEISNQEEGYLNDVMLAALHVMTHAEKNQEYLQNHINVLIDQFFVSDLLPNDEIFHGLTIKERYKYLRQEILESAYNRVTKKSSGTQDIAKYILYRGTVLAQSENWRTREQSLIENRALNELKKILEKRAKTNKIAGNIAAGSAAAAFAASLFCPWLSLAGAGLLVLSATYYDKESSFTATAEQVAQLSDSKKNLATKKENEKNNQIENWFNKNSELKMQKEILDQMKGSKTNTETAIVINYDSYIEKVAELTIDNKIISLEEIKKCLTEDIFNNAEAKNVKSIIEATELIISYLYTQQENSLENVENKAQVLRDSQTESMTAFWNSLGNDDIKNLKEKAETAFCNWDEIQHINNLINVKVKQLDSNVDIKKISEWYTTQIQEDIIKKIIEAQEINNQNKITVAELQWQQQIDDLTHQQESWIKQIYFVKNLSSNEWKKSEEKLNAKYNLWSKDFTDKYKQLNQNWSNSYLELIKAKEDWVLSEYACSSNISAEDSIKASIEKIQKVEGLTKATVETYLDEILNSSELTMLNNISVSLDSLAKTSNTEQIFVYNNLIVQSEAEIKAEKAVKKMTKAMELIAGKCASLQYEQELKAQFEGYLEKLKIENDGMKEWQETLALNNGYKIEGEISREAIIDATLMNAIKETQIMHKYEYFQINQRPEIEINKNGNGQQLMQNVINTKKTLEEWAEKIFGKGFHQNQIKEWKVDRKTAKEGITEDLKQREIELKNDLEELSNLGKIEYEDLTDKQQERYLKLSNEIVSVRDGQLGKHIGFSPVLKNNADPNKTKNDAIEYEGSGQMGLIMLDFQWNSLKTSYGMAELGKAGYDKRMWDDRNSSFKTPTLRSTVNVAMTIVGNATGQAWLSYLDEALFATLDLGGQYKSAVEIGLELAKTAATAAISAGMGAANDALSGFAENIGNTAGKIVANTAISAGTSYLTGVANNAVNSIYIDPDGKLGFDTDNFVGGFYSSDIISTTVGAGITGGLNSGLIGYQNSNVMGFNSQQIDSIQTLTNLAGGLSSSAVSFALTGNATFNLASAYGVGLLEFTIGKDGISSTIGMGGTNISYQNIVGAISGIQNANKNSQINSTNYDKMTLDALRSQWGFGDSIAKNQLDDIITGTTLIKFDEKGNEVAQSVTENGQKVIHINTSQNDGFIDLGLTLQHEAYRDGITSDAQSQLTETTSAVLGHTQMALAMASDSLYMATMSDYIANNQNLKDDLYLYSVSQAYQNENIFSDYVANVYDSTSDYWKLMDDGTLQKDGSGWLRDERGNLILNKDGKMIGASGEETGLLNIMYGGTSGKKYDSFDEYQKKDSYKLMSGMLNPYYDEGKEHTMENAKWDKTVVANLNMDDLMEFAGSTVATQVFTRYYDSTVDALYADMNQIDIGDVTIRGVTDNAKDRFNDLYNAKSNFYDTAGALVDYDEIKISGEYQDSIYKPDGTIDERFYVNYNNLHYGIDIGKLKESSVIDGKNVLAGLNGKIDYVVLDENSNGGYQIYINYGFDFEGSFISTGLYGEFDHLKNKPTLNINKTINANTVIGQVGNTGKHSLGSHLHYTMYINPKLTYSDSTAKILLGKDFLDSSMTNLPGTKTVFDPTYFFMNNRSKR